MLVYVEDGKPAEKPPAERREPTTNSKHIGHRDGIEPGPHWERRAQLATTLFLLPNEFARCLEDINDVTKAICAVATADRLSLALLAV